METKTSHKYSSGRSKLTVPQRGDAPAQATSPSKTDRIKRLLTRPTRRTVLIGGIILLVISLLLFTVFFTTRSTNSSKSPDYQAVLPKDKSIDELGGWQRISPPKSDPVFAYTDIVDTIPVTVSQQPLPGSLEGDTNSQVAELAKKFNATTKIDAGGTTVYVGTSAKGPQSAILTKNKLLILIKSQQNISNASWATYAQSLN